MAKSSHTIKGSGGSYCCNCSSAVGPDAKSQPQNVDGETWCPRCFVWRRMAMEPERFNASQSAACRCQFCGWVAVSFGAKAGHGLRCGHCGASGALRLQLTPEDAEGIREAVEQAAEAAAKA